MSYYTQVLQPEETVLFVGKLHWIIYLKAKFFLILGLIAYCLYFYTANELFLYAACGLAVLWLLAFFSVWLRRISTEIVVTDKRVIYKTGLISRHTMEMNVNKIETVDVVQSIAGRLFNYGTVIIRGTGTTYEPIGYVPSPLALRNAIIVH